MYPPFEGPKHILEHARKRAIELQTFLTESLQEFSIYFLPAGERGNLKTYYLQFDPPTSPEAALKFRDTLNNIRTALDILICDSALATGLSLDRAAKGKYPFAKNLTELRKIIKGMGFGDEISRAIEWSHPLHGNNPWLEELHKLDIIGKHQSIIPVYAVAHGTFTHLFPDEHIERIATLGLDLRKAQVPWCHGSLLHVRHELDPTLFIHGVKTLELTLPTGMPFSGISSSRLLNDLITRMTTVVLFFEALFSDQADVSQRNLARAALQLDSIV